MDTALSALLAELEEHGRKHDAAEPEHDKRMLNLERPTAEILALWVRSARRQRLLEIGTSNGYSTLWLAWAMSATGGHIISVDRDPAKHALADANLRRAALRDRVELITGDATAMVASLPGPFDCVFFDADRFSAPEQLALLLPRLAPDVLLFADNARSHPQEIARYLEAVAALPDFEHVVIPVGKGLSAAHRASATL
jgi:predicted O-methyltransferase YrrM